MRKERKVIRLALLDRNEGQLGWLPKNPRQWTQHDVDLTAQSIREDGDFLEDRPLLVVADGDRYCVFAGNLRREGCLASGMTEAPCVEYFPVTDDDRETVCRRAMKDNGSFGRFDWDEVANDPVWERLARPEFGIPVWQDEHQRDDALNLSTKGREGDEEYDAFVDKFKQKLTTDDCYTPPAVYDAVRDFVDQHITPLKGKTVVRPFVPGGDYEHYDYPANGIVIDNPPFSILSGILRFYCERKKIFFLFAPALTLFSAPDCDLTYIIADADITYENGASVLTGFITNLVAGLRIWVCPELGKAIADAQADEDKTKQQFIYPDNIVTSAILGKIAKRGVELKIPKVACEYIHESDSAKEQGRGLYGGGFILAERAAAERAAAERAAAERAAAERAAAERAAAERAAATKLLLSDRERAIIARLNEQYH